MPFVVAALAQKGGVGKTSLTTSLFAHLVCGGVSAGNTCGLLDLDPQGSATIWALGQRAFAAVPQHGGAEAFTLPRGEIARGVSAGNTTPETVAKHVIPCAKLGRGFVCPANQYMAVHTMDEIAFDAVPVDVLFVDTPPHLPAVVFRQIVAAANVVVSPVQPESYAVATVPDMMEQIAASGGQHLLDTNALRLVVTMRQKCATHAAWECVIREHFEQWVSPVVVPRSTTWADAANLHAKWNPKSTPAKMAAELWNDIQNTLQRRAAA
jgi:cellulose biosynthesis protein BcsQ